MDLLKAIDLRVSRRSYKDKEIGIEVEAEIRKIIEELNKDSRLSLSYVMNGREYL